MRGGSWCRGRVETERATEGRKRSTLYEYKRVGRKRKSGGGGGCHGETVSGHGAGSDSYLRTSRRIGCPPYNIYKKKKKEFLVQKRVGRERVRQGIVFFCVFLFWVILGCYLSINHRGYLYSRVYIVLLTKPFVLPY